MELGSLIEDRFVVEDIIGRGGVATVYRVRHQSLETMYAIKVLHTGSQTVKDRLIQEGKAQARMNHPNVVGVRDLFDIEGEPGLLLEYVDGPPLDQWLAANKPSSREAIEIFRGIVQGVGYAHDHGWVHRDLKPANVLMNREGDKWVPKVCDFGLVMALDADSDWKRATSQGVALGTPSYTAPEQIRDAASVDHRADLFSLGCILFELLCHERAFAADNVYDVYKKVVRAEFAAPLSLNPDLSPTLDGLIRSLLVVKRRKRLESCALILEILGQKTVFDLDASLVTPAFEALVDPDRDNDDETLSDLLDPADVVTVAASAAPGGSRGFEPTIPQVLFVLSLATFAIIAVTFSMPSASRNSSGGDLLNMRGPADTSEGDYRWGGDPGGKGKATAPPVGASKRLVTGVLASTPDALQAQNPKVEAPLGPSPTVLPLEPVVDDASAAVGATTEESAERTNILRRKRSDVAIEGDAAEVRFDRGQWLWRAGVALPAGSYHIEARWVAGGDWVAAGELKVRSGEPETLVCSSARKRCVLK